MLKANTMNITTNKDLFVIVRDDNGKLIAWKAPRGLNTDDRWTINPNHAYSYKTLSAALTAVDRLQEKYPEEFLDIKVTPLADMKEQTKESYSSISELLEYETKASRIFVADNGASYYFSTEEQRDQFIGNKEGFSLYTLKFVSQFVRISQKL